MLFNKLTLISISCVLFQWLFWRVGLWVVHGGQWWQDSPRQAVLCPAEGVFRGHRRCQESLCGRPGNRRWVKRGYKSNSMEVFALKRKLNQLDPLLRNRCVIFWVKVQSCGVLQNLWLVLFSQLWDVFCRMYCSVTYQPSRVKKQTSRRRQMCHFFIDAVEMLFLSITDNQYFRLTETLLKVIFLQFCYQFFLKRESAVWLHMNMFSLPFHTD